MTAKSRRANPSTPLRTSLISIKEAAARLDVSLVTLYTWLNADPPEISYVGIGGDRFVPELEVERIKRDRNPKRD